MQRKSLLSMWILQLLPTTCLSSSTTTLCFLTVDLPEETPRRRKMVATRSARAPRLLSVRRRKPQPQIELSKLSNQNFSPTVHSIVNNNNKVNLGLHSTSDDALTDLSARLHNKQAITKPLPSRTRRLAPKRPKRKGRSRTCRLVCAPKRPKKKRPSRTCRLVCALKRPKRKRPSRTCPLSWICRLSWEPRLCKGRRARRIAPSIERQH